MGVCTGKSAHFVMNSTTDVYRLPTAIHILPQIGGLE